MSYWTWFFCGREDYQVTHLPSGTADARMNCTWRGAEGEIVNHSDSHGLCYQVKHKDGTTAWYDPQEFESV